MNYLLDTNVLRELLRTGGNPAVRRFVEQAPEDSLHISVLSLGEIAGQAAAMPMGRPRVRLEQWLAQIQGRFAARVVGFDAETAVLWGRLQADARRAGRHPDTVRLMLAASALVRGMTIVTSDGAALHFTGAALRPVQ